MCRDFDDYGPEFMSSSTPRARKEHRCGECRRTIKVGETYLRDAGKCDGDVKTLTTCAHCARAQEWLVKQCNGFVYSDVGNDLAEHFAEGYSHPWMAEMVEGLRRDWALEDGTLMAVPASAPAAAYLLSVDRQYPAVLLAKPKPFTGVPEPRR